MLSKVSTIALLPALSYAAIHNVMVGANDALKFEPSTVMAAVGDTINYHFYSGDHSVAQSTFDSPCMPSGSNALFSGFINPSGSGVASMMFSTLVNSTDTMWLYCSQSDHCQDGMVMVVNPSGSETLAMYMSKASKAGQNVSPNGVKGGIVTANSNTGGLMGSMSASMSPAMMTSTMPASMTAMMTSMSPMTMATAMTMASNSMMMSDTMMTGTMTETMMTGSMGTATLAVATTLSTGAAPSARSIDMGLPGAVVAAAGVFGAWALV